MECFIHFIKYQYDMHIHTHKQSKLLEIIITNKNLKI